MNETSAIEVTLLQAFETAQPASANWTADDSAWATRLASASNESASDAHFIVQRAQHAMQRLLPREAGAAKWLKSLTSARPWWLLVAAVALLMGLLADSIGSAQRINLLAPPLWAVVLWNAAVYVWLLGQWAASWFQRDVPAGALSRWAQKLMRWGSPTPASTSSTNSAPALQKFAALWSQRSAPLSVTRAAVLLHLGSAALALGLIGGMYVRGLVLDYRASWESTFLSTESAHAALSFLLSPAAALANIELPNASALEALRESHSNTPRSGTSGAVWIHLYAVTLGFFVVLPRLALALWSALRARWLAQHVTLPLSDEYFARLLRQQQGRSAKVVVLPYANTPNAAAQLGLRAVLSNTLGAAVDVHVAATLAFGDEDDAPGLMREGSTLAIALFDLSATPEAENQGRFVQNIATQMASALSTVVMIDEAAFSTRFANAPDRLKQRRAAWSAWGSALGAIPVFVNLEHPDLKTAERDVLAAMAKPVRLIQA
jgi:Protein of unknown function (DUF2868)